MTRLTPPEQALFDTRQHVAAAARAAARLVDTRTIGKAPTFSGEHKDWPDWSFQCTAYMGSANPKSIEAPRWAAMEETQIAAEALRTRGFEKPDPQLCFAFALFVVQRKHTGDRETHRDQQRLEAVAWVERCVRQQQQRSAASANAVFIMAQTCRCSHIDDRNSHILKLHASQDRALRLLSRADVGNSEAV